MDTITAVGAFLMDQKTTLSVLISSGLGHILYKKWKAIRKENRQVNERPVRLVVITGCDSGLGLSMAYWAGKLGYKVLAGCLDPNGEGANYLRTECNQDSVKVSKLDVTDDKCIEEFRMECEQFLESLGENTKLWAVVSNAGVMVCGEWFWQTQDQRERQMKVNFWGTVNLVSAFQPMIFQHQSRIIVITSDCAQHCLPGLAIYDASKAAQESWARSLRLEVAKYGVSVVCYQPGSFPNNSQIFANSESHYQEMEAKMKESDKRFYGEYFQQWKEIKSKLSQEKSKIQPLEDKMQKESFIHLLEGDIRHISVYKYTILIQRLIHLIEDYFPHRLSDPFLCALMDNSAKWNGPKNN